MTGNNLAARESWNLRRRQWVAPETHQAATSCPCRTLTPVSPSGSLWRISHSEHESQSEFIDQWNTDCCGNPVGNCLITLFPEEAQRQWMETVICRHVWTVYSLSGSTLFSTSGFVVVSVDSVNAAPRCSIVLYLLTFLHFFFFFFSSSFFPFWTVPGLIRLWTLVFGRLHLTVISVFLFFSSSSFFLFFFLSFFDRTGTYSCRQVTGICRQGKRGPLSGRGPDCDRKVAG